MLIVALVMVGFTVGKGKWSRGRAGGVAEYRERVAVDERDVARQGTWSGPTPPSVSSASPAPVSEVRTCHLCLLENPAVGCISGSEKCTISSSSPCMVISINYGELSQAGKGPLEGQPMALSPLVNEGCLGPEV